MNKILEVIGIVVFSVLLAAVIVALLVWLLPPYKYDSIDYGRREYFDFLDEWHPKMDAALGTKHWEIGFGVRYGGFVFRLCRDGECKEADLEALESVMVKEAELSLDGYSFYDSNIDWDTLVFVTETQQIVNCDEIDRYNVILNGACKE